MTERDKGTAAGQRAPTEAQRSHKIIVPDVVKGQKNGQVSQPGGPPPSVSELLPPPVAPLAPETAKPTKE